MGRRRVSFKVAPGVRISASSRGVRTSIGTNKARVSLGGGRTYTSAKVAGVRVSQNTYASGRTSTRVSAGGFNAAASSAAPRRQGAPRPSLAQLERAAQADEVMRIEQQLTSLHLERFPTAAPEDVPAPEPVPIEPLVADYQRAAVKGIAFFRFSERRAAKAQARDRAAAEAAKTDAHNQDVYNDLLRDAAAQFQRLVEHDPEIVITAIDAAFADNASESTCVNAGTDEDGTRYVTVVIVFGPATLVPEKVATLTPAGKPTLKKRTKTDRNALYVRALASTVLATVREAMQTSPASDEVRVVVLQRDPQAIGAGRTVPIYTATFLREQVERARPDQVDLDELLGGVPDARFVRRRATADVVAIDLRDDPDLAQLVAQFASALGAS